MGRLRTQTLCRCYTCRTAVQLLVLSRHSAIAARFGAGSAGLIAGPQHGISPDRNTVAAPVGGLSRATWIHSGLWRLADGF
jgi:hypothetical protein